MGRCGLGGGADVEVHHPAPLHPTPSPPCPFCLRCYSLVSRVTLVPDPISQGIAGVFGKRLHPHFSVSKAASVPLCSQLVGLSILAGNGRPDFLPRVPSPLLRVPGLLRLPRPGSWTTVPDSAPEHVALDSSSLLPQSLSPSQSQRLGIHRLFSHLNRSEGQVC